MEKVTHSLRLPLHILSLLDSRGFLKLEKGNPTPLHTRTSAGTRTHFSSRGYPWVYVVTWRALFLGAQASVFSQGYACFKTVNQNGPGKILAPFNCIFLRGKKEFH